MAASELLDIANNDSSIAKEKCHSKPKIVAEFDGFGGEVLAPADDLEYAIRQHCVMLDGSFPGGLGL